MAYVPNPKFAEQLQKSPGVQRILRTYAQEGGVRARAIGAAIADTGAYAASIEVDETRLLTTDRAGHIIEWGSSRQAPMSPLRTAAEQTGARYEDTGP